jgi:SOS-response transcriptional repressor LexA
MTKTQARLLEFIRSYIAEQGYSPTIKEMAAGVGVYYGTAFVALTRLNERGYVIKDAHRYTKRSVRLPDGGARAA